MIHLHWDIPQALNVNMARLEFLVFLLGISLASHSKNLGITFNNFLPFTLSFNEEKKERKHRIHRFKEKKEGKEKDLSVDP